uniref:Uncharacterized protein n=1 Tax=Anguilla anguilla TaxID=7936 RepID=A0A0E9P748_ANGAN
MRYFHSIKATLNDNNSSGKRGKKWVQSKTD